MRPLERSTPRRNPLVAVAFAAWILAGCAPSPAPLVTRPRLTLAARPDDAVVASGISGRLTDGAGAPVADAVILAATGDEEDAATALTRTARDGTFHLRALAPGSWLVTATSIAGTARHGDPVLLERPGAHVAVALQLEPARYVLHGAVRGDLDEPIAGVSVTLIDVGPRTGGVYGVVADDAGNYRVGVATDAPLLVAASAQGRPRAHRRVSPGATEVATIHLSPPAAPRPDDTTLKRWLTAHAKGLSDIYPGATFDDIEPLAAMVGPARIVAMGEATHGSSQFAWIKHRLFEHLVEHEGFTVFALEAGATETAAIDDYVVRGEGRSIQALWGLQTWAWQTEEMRDLVEWMRRWNEDPRHARKVRFEGIDVTAFDAVRRLQAYLTKVDPGVASNFHDALAPLAAPDADGSYGALPPEAQAHVRDALEHVEVRLDERKRSYVQRSGAPAWDLAKRWLAAIRQAERVYRDPLSRDAEMADNVEAMLARYPAGTRAALWMHNAHVSAEAGRVLETGRILRERYGDAYFVLGFAFGHGGFRAFRVGDPKFEIQDLTVGEPLEGSFDAALALEVRPQFAIDLRTARDEVRDWLASPMYAWSIGGAFRDEPSARQRVRPLEAYDAVVYVDEVRPTRALPRLK